MDQENKKTAAAAKKEPAAPEKKEPEKNNIQELIDKAKAKGTLTNTEIGLTMMSTTKVVE